MRYNTAYPCRSEYCQCGQPKVYVQKSTTNNSGLIILAAALILLPLLGWGYGGFYY